MGRNLPRKGFNPFSESFFVVIVGEGGTSGEAPSNVSGGIQTAKGHGFQRNRQIVDEKRRRTIMSSFSRSGGRGHYPHQNYGSNHYKRYGSGGGLLGKIIRLLTGSKHYSHSSDHFRPSHGKHHSKHKFWS
jgi:hypothetical protein